MKFKVRQERIATEIQDLLHTGLDKSSLPRLRELAPCPKAGLGGGSELFPNPVR